MNTEYTLYNIPIRSIFNTFNSVNHNIDKINYCPACYKKGLWLKESFFRCFKSDCKVSGGGIKYLSLLNKISEAESIKLLSAEFKVKHTAYKPTYQQTQVRYNVKLLFDYLQQLSLTSPSNLVSDYFTQRGWNSDAVKYGYWPNSPDKHALQNLGFSKDILKSLNLLNYKGEEIYNNRIIFPITNIKGEVIHIQGRSLDPEAELRWLTNPGKEGEESVFNYFYNGHLLGLDTTKTLFLCEGISDALSLECLGLNVISSLNLYPPLLKYTKSLEKLDKLIVIYDNDKSTTGAITQYKSWEPVIDRLVELQCILPQLEILCVMPPEITGITDLNEWLISINYDATLFERHIQKQILPLDYFLISKFINKRDDIIKLIKLKQSILNLKLEKDKDTMSSLKNYYQIHINKQYTHWIDYLLE